MLLDDDKWALEDIKKSFSFAENGFEVTGEFRSAEDALAVILRDPPDLIVSDIRMQRASGLDMARVCREHGIQALIVLVSGYERFDYAQQALHCGVFDYLLKPLEDDAVAGLMVRVRAALARRQTVPAPAAPLENDALRRVTAYVDAHYDSAFTLEDVARMLYMNRNYLSDLFSRKMGMTFTRYKNSVRVHHAKEMLAGGGHTLSDIALAVGFDSSGRLSKVFKQVTGVTPQEYSSSLPQTGRQT